MKNTLELKPVELNADYRKKWNIGSLDDFCHLFKNGEKVSDTLYRIGGLGVQLEDDYFMLLKHVEAFYEDSITKKKDKKRHLKDCFCIIDNNGVEKVIFDKFASPYLQVGQVYSLNNKYYNIESGKLYCTSYTSMSSREYLFLNNQFDKDKLRRGVMKINNLDGTYELFPEKQREQRQPVSLEKDTDVVSFLFSPAYCTIMPDKQ